MLDGYLVADVADILDDGELIDSPHTEPTERFSLEDLEGGSDVFPLEIEGMPWVSYFEDSYFTMAEAAEIGQVLETLFTTAREKGHDTDALGRLTKLFALAISRGEGVLLISD